MTRRRYSVIISSMNRVRTAIITAASALAPTPTPTNHPPPPTQTIRPSYNFLLTTPAPTRYWLVHSPDVDSALLAFTAHFGTPDQRLPDMPWTIDHAPATQPSAEDCVIPVMQ